MKRLLFVLVSALLLFSCGPAITYTTVHVYDSAWNEVLTTTVSANVARSVSMSDIEVQVAAYNAAHDDDQYFLLDEEVPVTEAPDATAYIVRNDTYAVMYQATVPRTDIVERRAAYDMTARAMADPVTLKNIECTLFIDKIPELPPVPIIDPYVQYAIALIRKDGQFMSVGDFVYNEHCVDEEEYQRRYQAYSLDQILLTRDTPEWAPYTLLTRQLYIPPTVATP